MKKPTGLKRCPACREFRNPARSVLCICDGYVCGSCGVGRMRRPISDHYDEVDGRLWHTPAILGQRNCDCGARDWVPASEEAAA